MNSATAHWHPADTEALNAPSPQLAACLLASVVLHAVLLLVLPGSWQSALPEAPAMLDVVLMPADVPAAPMAQPVPERTTFAVKPPAQAVRTAPATPARAEIAVPATVAEETVAALVEPARAPVSATSAPATASRSEPALTPPVFNAAYLRNPPPRYPPAARRSGDEGTVLLKVLVTSDGAAARVELDRSSGSVLLDGAALDAVRIWRFVPARRGAQNVEDWVRVPVVFRLES